MPLISGDYPILDEGHFLSFTMRDADRGIRCHVQQGALDAIEDTRTNGRSDKIERFRRHRAEFEAVASDLYDAGLPIRITADHVSWLRRFGVQRERPVR